MSKHSKWAKVKHAKGIADQKRGKIFSKMARNIYIAAREGTDPSFNFKLRLAIDQAKTANMPKENIDRAIAKAAGAGGEAALKELVYEALGPAGSAFMIVAYSDNVNRTAGEIKHILTKSGGTLGNPGSVAWQFHKLGVIRIEMKDNRLKIKDKELKLIDAGAEDIKEEDEGIIVYSKVENFQKVKEALDELGISPESAGIEYVAKDPIEVPAEEEEKIEALIEAVDDYDDVDEVFTNLK